MERDPRDHRLCQIIECLAGRAVDKGGPCPRRKCWPSLIEGCPDVQLVLRALPPQRNVTPKLMQCHAVVIVSLVEISLLPLPRWPELPFLAAGPLLCSALLRLPNNILEAYQLPPLHEEEVARLVVQLGNDKGKMGVLGIGRPFGRLEDHVADTGQDAAQVPELLLHECGACVNRTRQLFSDPGLGKRRLEEESQVLDLLQPLVGRGEDVLADAEGNRELSAPVVEHRKQE